MTYQTSTYVSAVCSCLYGARCHIQPYLQQKAQLGLALRTAPSLRLYTSFNPIRTSPEQGLPKRRKQRPPRYSSSLEYNIACFVSFSFLQTSDCGIIMARRRPHSFFFAGGGGFIQQRRIFWCSFRGGGRALSSLRQIFSKRS